MSVRQTEPGDQPEIGRERACGEWELDFAFAPAVENLEPRCMTSYSQLSPDEVYCPRIAAGHGVCTRGYQRGYQWEYQRIEGMIGGDFEMGEAKAK